MPELDFQIEGAEAVPYAASPLLAFKLRITQAPEAEAIVQIQSVMLRCQIRLDPARRRYAAGEQAQLGELFGEPHRWGQTVRTMLWNNAVLLVPPFGAGATIDLPVPCSYDFNLAATKYFHALADGEVPLSFLFSGTIFYAGADGSLQVEQISWEKEATFRLPVSVWKKMMQLYYPGTAWLELHQDTYEQLNRYKQQCALPTWEQVFQSLLSIAQATPAEKTTP